MPPIGSRLKRTRKACGWRKPESERLAPYLELAVRRRDNQARRALYRQAFSAQESGGSLSEAQREAIAEHQDLMAFVPLVGDRKPTWYKRVFFAPDGARPIWLPDSCATSSLWTAWKSQRPGRKSQLCRELRRTAD